MMEKSVQKLVEKILRKMLISDFSDSDSIGASKAFQSPARARNGSHGRYEENETGLRPIG